MLKIFNFCIIYEAVDATVNFSVGGTATPGTDYNSNPVAVHFASGEISQTVTIPILNDSLIEPNETIHLILTNPTNGATIGANFTAVLTLVDDDSTGNTPTPCLLREVVDRSPLGQPRPHCSKGHHFTSPKKLEQSPGLRQKPEMSNRKTALGFR